MDAHLPDPTVLFLCPDARVLQAEAGFTFDTKAPRRLLVLVGHRILGGEFV